MKTGNISRLISALGQASNYEAQQPKVVPAEEGAASTEPVANTDAVKVASSLTSQTLQENEEAAHQAHLEAVKARVQSGEYKVDSKATAVVLMRDLA